MIESAASDQQSLSQGFKILIRELAKYQSVQELLLAELQLKNMLEKTPDEWAKLTVLHTADLDARKSIFETLYKKLK